MSIVLQANRGRRARRSQVRLRLAVSVAAIVALSGCVAVDDSGYRRRAPVQPGDALAGHCSSARRSAPHARHAAGVRSSRSSRRARAASSTALPSSSRTGRGNIVVKLVDCSTADAVQQMLGDTLGLNYVIEGEASGSITIQTARPVDQRYAAPDAGRRAGQQRAALINEGGFYRIAPAGSCRDIVLARCRLWRNVDRPRVGPGVQVVPLRYISAVGDGEDPAPDRQRGRHRARRCGPQLLILKDDSRNIASACSNWSTCSTSTTCRACRSPLLPVKNTSAWRPRERAGPAVRRDQRVADGRRRALRPDRAPQLRACDLGPAAPRSIRCRHGWAALIARAAWPTSRSTLSRCRTARPRKSPSCCRRRCPTSKPDDRKHERWRRCSPALTPVVTEARQLGQRRLRRVDRRSGGRRSPRRPASPIRIQADEANNSLLILATAEEFQLLQQVVDAARRDAEPGDAGSHDRGSHAAR